MRVLILIALLASACEKEDQQRLTKNVPIAQDPLATAAEDVGTAGGEDAGASTLFKMTKIDDMQNLAKKELASLAASSGSSVQGTPGSSGQTSSGQSAASSQSSGASASSPAGGGGSGVGTLGVGTYGAGAGTSSSPTIPPVRIGTPTVNGNLHKAIIRRYIRRKLPQMKWCYEKQLLIKPGLQGTVTASFVIDANGMVSKSLAKGVNAKVSACVANVIKQIRFPKPAGGGSVEVKYPFRFSS